MAQEIRRRSPVIEEGIAWGKWHKEAKKKGGRYYGPASLHLRLFSETVLGKLGNVDLAINSKVEQNLNEISCFKKLKNPRVQFFYSVAMQICLMFWLPNMFFMLFYFVHNRILLLFWYFTDNGVIL